MWFASHGYVCLIVDTLQLGEIAGIHHGTYREGRWWWQARGYTPAGVECWNGIRGIDYLISRPEVDPERIGVTGISGGGASTVWIAAADDRVKVAVPVSGMSDLESYVSNEVVNGHCDCMFLVNTYRWEWTTIAALIAPRPLLFANSDDDKIFPMDGNRRIIARLRDAYRMYEKADLVDDYVSKGGHDYRPDLRIAIFKWFHTHLKKDSAAVADAEFKPLPGKELRVFAEDKDLPADAINAKIDESFVATAKVELPAEGKFDEWKAALTKQLREKCFREWPVQVPRAKPIDAVSDKDMGFRQESETNIMVRMVYNEGNGRLRPTFYVMNVDEKLNELPKWAEDRFEGDIFTFYPRGSLALPWTRKNPPNTVERSMALLGRTADERRVWDSIASFRDIQFNSMVKEWRLAGRGQAGVMAAYAAILEPSVAEVVILEPPASHRDGPIFLNVLRVLDVSEALGLLAPRPLTIISNDPAFDKTAAIYKLAGAADKFKRVKPK
jgi:dienelactone hydrolase